MAHASLRREPPAADTVAAAADVLRHLSDPTRLYLLTLLTREPRQDVTTLTGQVTASRSSVSQHLSRLRLARLVVVHRDGRRMLYSLSSDHVTALVAEAYAFAEHLTEDR